jgi:hypothetical protein
VQARVGVNWATHRRPTQPRLPLEAKPRVPNCDSRAPRGPRNSGCFACGSLVCWNARADSRSQRACWAIGVSTRTHRHVCVKGRDGRLGEGMHGVCDAVAARMAMHGVSAHAAWEPMLQHASPCRGTTQPCSVWTCRAARSTRCREASRGESAEIRHYLARRTPQLSATRAL